MSQESGTSGTAGTARDIDVLVLGGAGVDTIVHVPSYRSRTPTAT